MIITCPHCKARVSVDESATRWRRFEVHLVCPSCGHRLHIEASVEAARPGPSEMKAGEHK